MEGWSCYSLMSIEVSNYQSSRPPWLISSIWWLLSGFRTAWSRSRIHWEKAYSCFLLFYFCRSLWNRSILELQYIRISNICKLAVVSIYGPWYLVILVNFRKVLVSSEVTQAIHPSLVVTQPSPHILCTIDNCPRYIEELEKHDWLALTHFIILSTSILV